MSTQYKELIDNKISKLYDSLMEKPLHILSIFNDFFGEERVDLQGYLSLDKFKSWMYSTPMLKYMPSRIDELPYEIWEDARKHKINEISYETYERLEKYIHPIRIMDCLNSSGMFILVHFPHVRITNENNRCVDINHLWAKMHICYDGTLEGNFSLNRSEYTVLHMANNFMHSHISTIPTNDFTSFQVPCLGNGPIISTITTLNACYDEDMWNMFCLELSKYVTVESLAGRPYHYLERLGIHSSTSDISRFELYNVPNYLGNILLHNEIKDFIKYFINKKKLKFNYANGSYSIGMSIPEYFILISNEFISWYNDLYNKGIITFPFESLKNGGILKECVIGNNKICFTSNAFDPTRYLRYIGSEICIFKGEKITLNIVDIAETSENRSIILEPHTALYILNITLKVLNYEYGRETADVSEDNQLSTKIWYL